MAHAFLTLEEKRRLNEGDYIARPKDSSMLSLLSVRCPLHGRAGRGRGALHSS